MTTTEENITDEQIKKLALEAAEAGDFEMVRICKRALGQRPGDASLVDRRECAHIIADTEGQK